MDGGKKSSRRAFKLLVMALVLIGLLAVYFALGAYNEHVAEEKAEAEKETVMFSFSADDAVSFYYMYKSSEYAFDKNENGDWVYREDNSLNLDQNAVENILYNFTNVTTERVAAESLEKAADYGLDDPRAFFTAVLTDGSEKRLNIGDENTMMDIYYAYEDGKSEIFTITPSVYQMLVPVEELTLEP